MSPNIYLLLFSFILCIGILQGHAQNIHSVELFQSSHDTNKQKSKTGTVFWSTGPNISKYLSEDGGLQFGYRLGLTFNITISTKTLITLPFSYNRINTASRNVEGKFYTDDGYIYKTYVNREISVGFLELPILFSYNFYSSKKYNFSYLLGPGMVIATKDFSKSVQPEDVMRTDEIIGMHDYPLDPVETGFTIPNSGLNLNTGIRLNVNRFYLDILYILYPYSIKEINKLNSISLIFSIDMG